MTDEATVQATLHVRGDARLDAVVDLVNALAVQRPLASALDAIPAGVARVFRSEVCSVYLREAQDLVMRGNVGFAQQARGEVRLAVGEGLVGMCVEIMRPVSVASASGHERYRVFPALGEERYPAFLAVPVPGSNGPSGALVVQRTAPAYEPHEVELLTALAGAIAPVVGRARIVQGDSERHSGTRRVTLTGRNLLPGRALGIVTTPRRPSPREAKDAVQGARELMRRFDTAVMVCDAGLDAFLRAARRQGFPTELLEMHRMILDDGRFRERTAELLRTRGLSQSLSQVAREATRSARETGVASLVERAEQLSELCDVIRVLAMGDRYEAIPRGGVWVCDGVTAFELLLASRFHPAALVLTGPAPTGSARTLIDLLAVPTVAEVTGALNWASDGDVALVDGDHGLVRVNPTRRERDELREARHHTEE